MSVERMRARIENINKALEMNKSYFRHVRINNYLYGQAVYMLGDYPARVYTQVTDYDRVLVKQLADAGVKLIQLHEDWNDPCRLYGADKYSSSDPEGARSFVELCHSHGIKVIAYVSTGFINEFDPDFKEEYSVSDDIACSFYYKYRRCDVGHPGWRKFITEKTLSAMDNYSFDGIYNDLGYSKFDKSIGEFGLAEDAYDPELEDALGEIYHKIKQRNGIYKIHIDANNKPPCRDRTYDYIWIGEGVEASKSPIGIGKDFYDYVVPCHMHFNERVSSHLEFVKTIPFMQFPLHKTGRIVKANNLDLPGVKYFGGPLEDFFRRVRAYNDTHPDGPYVRSHWSMIPDDPEDFNIWEKYSKLYQPMVTDNSVAYIELRECTEILSSLSNPQIVASMFVNEKIYIVASNLSGKPYELVLKNKWENRETGEVSSKFTIKENDILFLVSNW